MKFTISTRPLKNVTNLGIIKANISQFYERSELLQIVATRDTLHLNLEAAGIKTKMTLKGSGDSDSVASILVECAKFKQLIDSIDTEIMTLEFIPGGLSVHAGTSKFSIAQLADINDMQLDEPISEYTASSTVAIPAASWQFVKDHQIFALATSDKRPVYQNVWVGDDHGVIAGDMDIGMFAYSKQGSFDKSCLLPASIINLFTSIPEGSTVSRVGNNYVLNIETDSYSMITEFTPKYEEDSAVGSYNADMILKILNHPESFITIDIAPIIKFINQTSIVNQAGRDKLFTLTVADHTLTLTNRVSSYSMDVDTDDSYTVIFATEYIKKVLANLDSDNVNIAPMIQQTSTGGTRVVGCIFWTEKLTLVLAGQG